jgi:predicted AAA+ superfamily ATPase
LDLERASDLARLEDPELFFRDNAQVLVCLDEIQRSPELFAELRWVVDERGLPGQFLVLGSASPALLQQGSETLAGRIHFLDLAPFSLDEVGFDAWKKLWIRGGFPRSYLASSGPASLRWRVDFIRTFLERDLPQFGFNLPAAAMGRLWTMLAHNHGQLLNASQLGSSLGLSHTTIRRHLDRLEGTYMIRVLRPCHANTKKRLVRSPRIYVRDSGVLHALLGLAGFDDVLGHPVFGPSWAGFCIDQILAVAEGWRPSFYRTAQGSELDLVLERGRQRIAFEFKASTAPKVKRGFHIALQDLGIDEAWIVAPVSEGYPFRPGIRVAPPSEVLERLMR